MAHGRGEFESLRPLDPLDDGEPGGVVERDSSIIGLTGEDGRLDLAPRSVAQVVDTALELVRHRFVVWIGVSAVLWLPVRSLQTVLGPHTWTGAGGGNPFLSGEFDWIRAGGAWLANIGAITIVQSLAMAYVSLGVSAVVDGRPFRPWVDLGQAFRRLVGLLVIAFVTFLASIIGMLMCCIPYVYLSWKLVLWPSAYIVENTGIAASLTRTIELTRASFGRWVGILILAGLFFAPYSSLAAFGDNPDLRSRVLSTLAISNQTLDSWLVPLTSLANAVTTTIMSATMTVFYFDCRARRDGADLRRELELLTERAAQGGGGQSAVGAR